MHEAGNRCLSSLTEKSLYALQKCVSLVQPCFLSDDINFKLTIKFPNLSTFTVFSHKNMHMLSSHSCVHVFLIPLELTRYISCSIGINIMTLGVTPLGHFIQN
jgi:hypothetical protein